MNRVSLFCLFYLASAPCFSEALPIYNLSPWHRIYSTASLSTPLPAKEETKFHTELRAYLSNYFANDSRSGEQVRTDGELWRAEASLRYFINTNWSLLINLPYSAQSSGEFDAFIYDWHEFFGLPQGGRLSSEENRLDVHYQSDQVNYRETQNYQGFSDVFTELNYQWALDHWLHNVQLSIDWPTGKKKSLLSNGRIDSSIGYSALYRSPGNLWEYWHGISLNYLGTAHQSLSALQRHWSLGARVGYAYNLTHALKLLVQLDGHTASYKSDTRQLGDPALQLSGAVQYQMGRYTLLFSISEDPYVQSSPDITTLFSLSRRF